jgi:hypothetical protein
VRSLAKKQFTGPPGYWGLQWAGNPTRKKERVAMYLSQKNTSYITSRQILFFSCHI